MPRQPIELVRPTFDPGFLGQIYASSFSAGVGQGRNRVAMAEIASRERLAAADRALAAAKLSQNERLALQEIKSSTERFLLGLEARREERLADEEFRRDMAQEDMAFRRELQTTSPQAALADLKLKQSKAWDRVADHLGKGGSVNDPEIQGDLARGVAGSSAVNDFLKTRQFGGGTGPDGLIAPVGSRARALKMAGGNESMANQIQNREQNALDQMTAMEAQLQELKDLPPGALADPNAFVKLRSDYVGLKALVNGWQQSTGEEQYVGIPPDDLMTKREKDALAEQAAAEAEAEEPGLVSSFIETLTRAQDLPFVLGLEPPRSRRAAEAFLAEREQRRGRGLQRGLPGGAGGEPVIINQPPTQGLMTNDVNIRLRGRSGTTNMTATLNAEGNFRIQ